MGAAQDNTEGLRQRSYIRRARGGGAEGGAAEGAAGGWSRGGAGGGEGGEEERKGEERRGEEEQTDKIREPLTEVREKCQIDAQMDTDVVNKNMKIVPRGDQNGAQRRGTSGEGAQGPKMGSACES